MSDTARHNMIERQLRVWEVLDAGILAAYADDALRRERFVADDAKKPFAYADTALPLADGEVMLEPKLEARMLQALALRADESILHIGVGSGFFTALLGKFAGRVTGVEINPAIAEAARARLAGQGNISVITANGAPGHPAGAPYNAIVYTASLPRISAALAAQLAAQLADNGRALAIVGAPPAMPLRLFRKIGAQLVFSRDILETNVPPLRGAPDDQPFDF